LGGGFGYRRENNNIFIIFYFEETKAYDNGNDKESQKQKYVFKGFH